MRIASFAGIRNTPASRLCSTVMAAVSMKSRLSAQEHQREWNGACGKSLRSRRRSGRAIPIYPAYVSRYQTGMQNSASCKTRYESLKIRSRVERLEDEPLPLPAGPTLRLNINAVDEEGKAVSTTVFEVRLPPPSNRRGRKYPGPTARRDW